MTYAVLQIAGFDTTPGATNTATALFALSAMFIGVPILLCALAALTLRNYPLDETRQAALAEALAARHAANNENTLGPSTK